MGKKVGFIGLGEMGQRMGENLIKAGFDVNVFNRTASKAKKLTDKGALLLSSPKEVAENSDVIISMVQDDNASQEIWLHPETGAIHGMNSSKVAIECSTLSYDWTLELHRHFKQQSIPFLEAPLIGTLPQAEASELVFFVAGSNNVKDMVQEIFPAMGKKTVFLGDPGSASAMKLSINSLFAIQATAFGEWFSTLQKNGFSREQLGEIFPELPITSPTMKVILGQMLSENFSPMFPMRLVEKDMSYATKLVEGTGNTSFVTKASREAFKESTKRGKGDLNISGIIKLFK